MSSSASQANFVTIRALVMHKMLFTAAYCRITPSADSLTCQRCNAPRCPLSILHTLPDREKESRQRRKNDHDDRECKALYGNQCRPIPGGKHILQTCVGSYLKRIVGQRRNESAGSHKKRNARMFHCNSRNHQPCSSQEDSSVTAVPEPQDHFSPDDSPQLHQKQRRSKPFPRNSGSGKLCLQEKK